MTERLNAHCEMLLTAFQQCKGVDVELMFPDDPDKTIRASKFILACNSSVFEEMLANDWKERRIQRIQIDLFDYRTMYELIKGMYSGQLEAKTLEDGFNLVRAADYYQAGNLKRAALDQIERITWSDQDLIQIILFADEYKLDTLFRRVISEIRDKELLLTSMPDYTKKIKGNAELVTKMFDQLIAISRSTQWSNTGAGDTNNNWNNTNWDDTNSQWRS